MDAWQVVQWIFIVAGGTCVALLVGGIVALVVARLLIGWFLGQVDDAADKLAEAGAKPMPFRIGLEPIDVDMEGEQPDELWPHPKQVDHASEQLETQGLERVGDYQDNDGAELRIRGFVHHSGRLVALVRDAPELNQIAVDIIMFFPDGTTQGFTNQPMALPSPPFSVMRRFPDADAGQLVAKALAEQPSAAPIRVEPEDFPRLIEEHYAREMDWLVNRGGFQQQEVQEMLETTAGQEFDEETVQLLHSSLAANLSQNVQEVMRRRLLEVTAMSAAQWDRIEDQVYIVHPASQPDELTDVLSQLTDLPEDDEDEEEAEAAAGSETDLRSWAGLQSRVTMLCQSHGPREAFSRLIHELPEGERVEHLTTLQESVPADVYVLPNDLEEI